MMPAPPRDQRLLGLGAALDEAAMLELLAPRLSDGGRYALESCRPVYARYKPGTSCLVQYRLGLEDRERGAPLGLLAHARLFAGSDADRIGDSPTLGRLVARAARRHPAGPSGRAFTLPDLGALVEVYPVDRGLPALVRAASPRKMRRLLRDALGSPSLGKCRVELIRYKPARKALFRYAFREAEAVYGKIYAHRTSSSARLRLTRSLAAAGVPSAPPLAELAELGMLVHAEAPGRRLADLRGLPEFHRWVGAAGEALELLHRSRVHLPLGSRRAEAGVRRAGLLLETLVPGVSAEVRRLVRILAAHLTGADRERVPIHGDFYDDQLLVSDRGVTILDFDEAVAGDPLVDVGNFVAHLSRDAALTDARETFLEAYGIRDPAVLIHESAALLQLAVGPFRRLEPRWPEEVERIIRLAASRLAEYGRRDRALPQLPALHEPGLVSRELKRSLGATSEVSSVAVVRHKRGRRCTLRYGVRRGAVAERVYGKTYSNGRGAGVYATLRQIEAVPWGPDVAVPAAVAYVPELKLLVQREVPGTPVARALCEGDEGLARRIADAIHTLHCARIDLRVRTFEDELAPLVARVKRFCEACPPLAPRARRCLELAARGRTLGATWRQQPVHRDFYHDQILVGPDGLSLLDFDDAALSEPALDVANFVAHLRLLGLQERGAADALAPLAEAFAARYHELAPELDGELVCFLEGATLLRLAEIHLGRGGAGLAGALLAESERRLGAN